MSADAFAAGRGFAGATLRWWSSRLKSGRAAQSTGEVRLADNWGTVEEHLYPGTANMDFAGLFRMLESRGYKGHYMQDYTTIEEMLSGRDILARIGEETLADA